MAGLIIVASVDVRTDSIDRVKAALQQLVEPTRAESGCLQYDLHQDNDNPAHFLFYERWASREQWRAHMDAPHLEAFREATQGLVESFAVHEMTRLG